MRSTSATSASRSSAAPSAPSTVPPSAWTLGDDVQAPVTRQLSLGWERAFEDGLTLRVDGLLIDAKNQPSLRHFDQAGFAIVTVTNQSGVARGYYTEADYHAVARRLTELLAAGGVAVDDTRYCFHHPDHSGPCDCRKPATGMYESAAAEHAPTHLHSNPYYKTGGRLTTAKINKCKTIINNTLKEYDARPNL